MKIQQNLNALKNTMRDKETRMPVTFRLVAHFFFGSTVSLSLHHEQLNSDKTWIAQHCACMTLAQNSGFFAFFFNFYKAKEICNNVCCCKEITDLTTENRNRNLDWPASMSGQSCCFCSCVGSLVNHNQTIVDNVKFVSPTGLPNHGINWNTSRSVIFSEAFWKLYAQQSRVYMNKNVDKLVLWNQKFIRLWSTNI